MRQHPRQEQGLGAPRRQGAQCEERLTVRWGRGTVETWAQGFPAFHFLPGEGGAGLGKPVASPLPCGTCSSYLSLPSWDFQAPSPHLPVWEEHKHPRACFDGWNLFSVLPENPKFSICTAQRPEFVALMRGLVGDRSSSGSCDLSSSLTQWAISPSSP